MSSMNTYFDDENTNDAKINLYKAKLLKQEQRIGGLTYSIVVFFSLLANFIFSLVVIAIANKLFPNLSANDALIEIKKNQLYRYSSFIIIPLFMGIAILSIVFYFQKKPIDLGFKKCNPFYLYLSMPIFLGLFFGLSWVNSLFLKAINYQPSDIMPNLDGIHFYIAILVIAVLPAVVEEIVFRGLVLNGLKGNGTIFACFVSGMLFSIFHMNPEQTIYQFICGTIFAYIAIRANSILPTMLIHFFNNFIALCNYKFNFWETGNALIKEGSALYIIIIVLAFIMLFTSLGFLMYSHYREYKKNTGKASEADRKIQPKKWVFFLYSGAGIIGAVGMWFSVLLASLITK